MGPERSSGYPFGIWKSGVGSQKSKAGAMAPDIRSGCGARRPETEVEGLGKPSGFQPKLQFSPRDAETGGSKTDGWSWLRISLRDVEPEDRRQKSRALGKAQWLPTEAPVFPAGSGDRRLDDGWLELAPHIPSGCGARRPKTEVEGFRESPVASNRSSSFPRRMRRPDVRRRMAGAGSAYHFGMWSQKTGDRSQGL